MKRILLLFSILISLMPSSLYATSQDVEMIVGETRTLYLPSTITSLTLKSVNFYSTSISNVEVVSSTNYSVTIRAIKAFSLPVIVRCDYYYYINSGTSVYQASGGYDFNITVIEKSIVEPTSITLSSSIISVPIGETRTITATVLPEDAVYTLSWAITSGKSFASVNDGVVTGLAEGEAALKVSTDNGLYKMCHVVVTKPEPTSVSISPTSVVLEAGKYLTLTASVIPNNADKTISWSTDDSEIATVNTNGEVYGKNKGSTIIRATTKNGLIATCNISVVTSYYTFTLERGMATLGHISGLDFSCISGLKAYVASEYDENEGVVKFEQVYQAPGKTGLLIVGEPGTYTIPKENISTTILQNYLQATWVQTKIYPYFEYDNTSSYILTNGSYGIAFYAVSEEGYMPANRAYLRLPQSENMARTFRVVLDDTSDIIDTKCNAVENDVWFSINGMRLSNRPSRRGVYIHNNKKKYIIR